MKIVIVGCGKVGSSIATELNSEGHEITVVDINRGAVNRLSESLDVMGIEGNGVEFSTLDEAEAETADLVIAATAHDEVNLYTCLMAKTIGARHTIARVRKPEYTDDLHRVKDLLGLSMSINPELTAGVEISQLLRFSGALEVDTFARGLVEIIKVTVPESSPICGKAVSRIDVLKGKVRICTVERGGEVYIPNGDFVINVGDRISIVTRSENTAKFFKRINVDIGKNRDVIILGGGKTSYYLAQLLMKAGASVKIIERNAERCAHLSEILHDATIIHGDCMDQDLLLSEGIEHVDGVVALMDYDEENILISLYIKGISRAKVITKVNNEYFDNIVEQLDLQHVINPKKIAGEYIARYVRAMQNSFGSNVETLYRLNEGMVEALEFKAKEGARVLGKPLSKLSLKSDLQVICIIRRGKVLLPSGSDSISADDSVIIITKHKGLSDLDDIIDRR